MDPTRLPRRKLEPDDEGGTVAQATRNTTTMPGVQLEMNDLPAARD